MRTKGDSKDNVTGSSNTNKIGHSKITTENYTSNQKPGSNEVKQF